MEQGKKFKTIKLVSLIVLTIIIVSAIVLTIYLVDKDSKTKIIDIKDEASSFSLTFSVNDIIFDKSNLDDGYTKIYVYMDVKAKRNTSIETKDFNLNDYELINISGDLKLKKNQETTIVLEYIVPINSVSLNLECYKYTIRLGTSMMAENN